MNCRTPLLGLVLRFGVCPALAVLCLWFPRDVRAEAAAPTPQESALWDAARASQKAQLGAIQTLELEYTCQYLNPLTNTMHDATCRLALKGGLDGGKTYHFQTTLANGQNLGDRELAYDGVQAYARVRSGLLVVNDGVGQPRASSELPHETFGRGELTQAWEGQDCRFSSARELVPGGNVEFTFMYGEGPHRLLLACDRQQAYMPVEIVSEGDTGAYVVSEIRYARIEDHGNVLYYPIHAKVHGRGLDGSSMYVKGFAVKPESIRINQKIDDERFRLTPRTDEKVMNPMGGELRDLNARGERPAPRADATASAALPMPQAAASPPPRGLSSPIVVAGAILAGLVLVVAGVAMRRRHWSRAGTP
jgi:hypothetical protein